MAMPCTPNEPQQKKKSTKPVNGTIRTQPVMGQKRRGLKVEPGRNILIQKVMNLKKTMD